MSLKLRLSTIMTAVALASCVSFVANASEVSGAKITEEKFDMEKRITRLLEIKTEYGVSGVDDHFKEHTTNTKNSAHAAHSDFHAVLLKNIEKYTEIEAKVAFLAGYNALLKDPDHIHLNHNFQLPMSAKDKRYVDGLYIAYLTQLGEQIKHLDLDKDKKELQAALNEMSRKAPYEFYIDDLKKIQPLIK